MQTQGLLKSYWKGTFHMKKGMYFIEDKSGTNIDVQIFDTAMLEDGFTGTKFNDLKAKLTPIGPLSAML